MSLTLHSDLTVVVRRDVSSLVGPRIGWFSICLDLSCSKDGGDDVQAVYISKQNLEVNLGFFFVLSTRLPR